MQRRTLPSWSNPSASGRSTRAQRLLALTGNGSDWIVPEVKDGHCLVTNDKLLSKENKLHLEAFEYEAATGETVAGIGAALADMALPGDGAYQYFRDKLASDLVILSDTDFGYFVENATLVEPHVRINEATGTADGGGLFYTENLPPESLLISPLLASRTRSGKEEKIDSKGVMLKIRNVIDGKLLQIGGDATTGRGLIMPIAAVPDYLAKENLSDSSPGLRFGMYLPLWGINSRSREILWTTHDINYRKTGKDHVEREFKDENKRSALEQATRLTTADQKALRRFEQALAGIIGSPPLNE